MTLWELVSLELDYPAREIGKYFEKELKIKRVKCRKEKIYDEKTTICRIVNRALGKSSKRKLVMYGSGFYHHFTYGLCRHADRVSEDYAYIHFDHHDDSRKLRHNRIDCGAFVKDILEDTNASAVLYIGTNAPKNLPVPNKLSIAEYHLRRGKRFQKLEWKLKNLPEEVYLSFDLDVMDKSIIGTVYDQGSLKTRELMKCISLIKRSKHIIGADVLGYRGVRGKVHGKELYKKIVNSLLAGEQK